MLPTFAAECSDKAMTVDEERAVIDAELRLLTPAVRSSRDAVSELLDPDFVEFGASGRKWDRHAILDMLSAEVGQEVVSARDIEATRLSDSVIQVRFRSQCGARGALRSSLWRRGEDGRWRMVFHQGTPTAG